MRLLSGVPEEEPQRTHRWNNHHLPETAVAHLKSEWMVSHPGNPAARTLPLLPFAHALAHVQKWGGWPTYLVLQPLDPSHTWYVGWRWQGGAGVSRVAVRGSLRVLVGPNFAEWFGIGAANYVKDFQIPIEKVGEGEVADDDSVQWSHLPLF